MNDSDINNITSADLLTAQHSLIQEDFKSQVHTQLSLLSGRLRQIRERKEELDGELARVKHEIRDINVRYKEQQIQEVPSFEESSFNNSDRDLTSGGGDVSTLTLNLNRNNSTPM